MLSHPLSPKSGFWFLALYHLWIYIDEHFQNILANRSGRFEWGSAQNIDKQITLARRSGVKDEEDKEESDDEGEDEEEEEDEEEDEDEDDEGLDDDEEDDEESESDDGENDTPSPVKPVVDPPDPVSPAIVPPVKPPIVTPVKPPIVTPPQFIAPKASLGGKLIDIIDAKFCDIGKTYRNLRFHCN